MEVCPTRATDVPPECPRSCVASRRKVTADGTIASRNRDRKQNVRSLSCGRRTPRLRSRIMRSATRFGLSLVLGAIAVAAAFTPARTQAQGGRSSPDPARGPFDALHFRDIGPAASGGRIHDLQIDPKNPAVLYVGSASGGIWKSTNKGLTWKDIFGKQPDNTFGSLAIFEGDTKIIWAGTGENNNRQSS